MSASRSGTLAHVEVDPDLALGRHLGRSRTSAPRRRGPAAPPAAPASSSSSEHSSSFFSSNGSPICTVGRLSASASPSSALASTDAPPIPSRPVRAPNSTHDVADARGGAADQLVGLDQPDAHRVDRGSSARTGPRSRSRRRPWRRRSSCRSGRCPPPRARAGSASARTSPTSPKRSESRIAIGRAPIANTSRRIPPTPVAAPWNGSTALGWLCDSTLNAHASPSPTDDRAGVLARARGSACGALGRAASCSSRRECL